MIGPQKELCYVPSKYAFSNEAYFVPVRDIDQWTNYRIGKGRK